MLSRWCKAVAGATIPGIRHFVFFIGESVAVPPINFGETIDNFSWASRPELPGLSIGHYHNLGARLAETEWIMKMDVDTIPHVNFFKELLPVLQTAGGKEWFNCGMVYLDQTSSDTFLSESNLPLQVDRYSHIMENRKKYSGSSYLHPAATNFICRRQSYLDLGGCDERFQGWGWEDYQQIYMLEKHQLGSDPLPGAVTRANVTARCRDEISRRKALDLWKRNHWLCLLHHAHPSAVGSNYKTPRNIETNRGTLLGYIQSRR